MRGVYRRFLLQAPTSLFVLWQEQSVMRIYGSQPHTAKSKPNLFVLENIHVAAPCPADWTQMSGDDRVRHCSECNLNVYNLSEMTRAEAERLILSHEGRLCARFY